MKIAILTLPFRHNYGGLLQAYALQKVLTKMGHQVWTGDRSAEPVKRSLWVRFKNLLCFLIRERKFIVRNLTASVLSTNQFIKSNIRLIAPGSNAKDFFSQYGFDAYIVGSDQVWRPCYSPFLYNCFLDFTKDAEVKRIVYAASFGSDEWEFTPEQTARCAALLKKFDAVSVRETTGIQLCEEHFGVKAKQALDPTLLLTEEDYRSLIEKNPTKKCEKDIVAYILDMNIDKQQILSDISIELPYKRTLITLYPYSQEPKGNLYQNKYYLSVESWLTQISKADFVITDSFHGCVFAILFNKPFVAIENEVRGSTRFHSFLNLLDLQDRMVNSYSDFVGKKTHLIHNPIDYDKVNSILNIKRNESMQFLTKALSNHSD
jgi:polysaccharide pyruvyl transferase WcaK-like protein